MSGTPREKLIVNFFQGPDYTATVAHYTEEAAASATAAAQSEYNANAYSAAAGVSAQNAANSETAAGQWAANAANSAADALRSANNAHASEVAAGQSEDIATAAASAALASENAAASSAGAAANSATAASGSANAASGSADAAAVSANAAAASAQVAISNANTASTAATTATTKASQAVTSAQQAQASATAAGVSATNAASSAQAAANSATTASNAATTATTKAQEAATSAQAAATSATEASTANTEAKYYAKVTMDKIAESAVGYPSQVGTLTYNGTVQSPTWDVFYEPNKMTVTGDTSGTNAGTYTITMTPKPTYYWWDTDTTTTRTQTWVIDRATIANVPTPSVVVYDGTVQSPTWTNYDPTELTIAGQTSGTDMGTYTVTFTPTSNYQWYDGTTTAKTVTWEISPATVAVPTVTGTSFTYDGTAQGPTIGTYDSALIEVTGDSATNAGSYAVNFHLKSASLQWTDTTTADKQVAWSIAPAAVTPPTVTNTTVTYTGAAVGPTVSAYDSSIILQTGTATAVLAGNYTITFALVDGNYIWSDDTTASKSTSWSIIPATVAVPTLSNTSLTYNGTAQGPIISPHDSDLIQVSGDVTATNAGNYTITFHLLNANVTWTDDTTADKTASWSIAKAAGSMSLSKSSVSLDMSNLTDTVTVTRTGDGVITATSADPSIATASVSGNVITITAIANGSTTITVSVAAGTNYLAPADQNISVTASLVSTTLNDNSWAIISAIAQAGQGANYWNIGDCKEVTLNGKIGNFFTASNLTLCVFILDFNHKNNGVSDNNIIFGCFKNALTGGKDIALADSNHGSSFIDGTKHFNMNHWGNYNYGGWKGSDLRYDILGATSSQPSDYGRAHTTSCVGYDATDATITNPKSDTFLAALPSDLRSVLRLWDRWVDVKGNKSDTNANVQKTVDAVSLLAEFEIFGVRTYANQYEKDHQSQMTYYSNGNSRVKYRNDDTSSSNIYWECSPYYNSTNGFCFVGSNGASGGSSGDGGARYPYLLAPAFKV